MRFNPHNHRKASMSQHLTRRQAVTTVLAGAGLTMLAACSSNSSTNTSNGNNANGSAPSPKSSNPHGYSDDGNNYSGRITFDNFEPGSTYEPGNTEHPPQNAPMPKMPDNANENSVTGFHATVAYYAAAMDYLVKTGSLDAVKKVKLAGNDAQENEALAKSIAQGIEQKTWYVDPSAWYELKESQPAIMSDGNLLFKSVYTFDYGAESVTNGEIKPVKEEERVSTQDCDFRGRYNPTTKSWELNLSYGTKSSGNAAASPAASATGGASDPAATGEPAANPEK